MLRWAGILALLAACGDDPEVPWRIAFEPASLGTEAVHVEAFVIEGGCAGTTEVFRTVVGSSTATASELEPGTYGFAARAADARCEWYAAGCTDVTVPREEAVRTVLVAETPASRCGTGVACLDGRCEGETFDAGPPDAGPFDAGPPTDGGAHDPCPGPSGDVLAWYDFEIPDDPGRDLRLPGHHGTEMFGMLTQVRGQPGCGNALQFPMQGPGGTAHPIVAISDTDGWIDGTMAFELWAKFDEVPVSQFAILSRDAFQSIRPGHFTLYYMQDRRIYFRLQGQDRDGGVDPDFDRCSNDQIALGRWVHIGVNFGNPVELWIDGVRQTYVGQTSFHDALGDPTGDPIQCGDGTGFRTIAGNDNPFSLGASQGNSEEGDTISETTSPVSNSLVDYFVVYSSPQDFTGRGP